MHMYSLLSIVVLGFILGMRHATDPDHVIAISTIVARNRTVRDAALIGTFWGIGHTLTLLVVGGSMVLLGWVIPVRLGLSMEFSVGLMLILLGILNLTGIRQWLAERFSSPAKRLENSLSAVPHRHGDYVHTHPHGNSFADHPHSHDQTPLSWLDRHFGRIGLYQFVRPLVVGVVHGLAGSAAIALLVLTTIRNAGWAMAYLLVFGIGTIAGMMLITATVAAPFAFCNKLPRTVNSGIRVASGLLSLGFGLFLAYHVGFVRGLFTGRPQSTPVTVKSPDRN